MSLFKKTVWSAYAATSPLVDDKDIPNTIVSQIVHGAMMDGNLSEFVVYGSNISLPAQVRKMLWYARKKYFLGLPTSNYTYWTEDEELITATIHAAIDAVGPAPIDLVWQLLSVEDPAYQDLKIKSAWMRAYARITWPDGVARTWSENDAQVPVPVVNPDTGDLYIALNDLLYTWIPDDIFHRPQPVRLAYKDNLGANKTYVEYFPPDKRRGWVYAAFYKVLDPSRPSGYRIDYWFYEQNTHKYPALDEAPAIAGSDQLKNDFLPMAMLMHDKVNFNEDPDSEWAVDTNKLLKYITINGDDIMEQYELEEIKKMEKWDFYIHFGVPLHTKVQGGKEYLFKVFKHIAEYSEDSLDNFAAFIEKRSSALPIEEFTVNEAGPTGYDVAYRWSVVHMDLLPPSLITDKFKNKYHIEFFARTQFNGKWWEGKWAELFPHLGEVKRRNKRGRYDLVVITHYPKDIKGVAQPIERIVIVGLSMEYSINTKADGKFRTRRYQPMLARAWTVEEKGEFIFPMNIGVLDKIWPIAREEAIANGLQATAFLVNRVKVYRTAFRWIVVIIAIILIIITWQYQFLPGVAALIAGSSAFFFYAALFMLSMLFGMFISFAASMIGNEWLRLAFTLFAMYMGMGKGGFKNMWTNMKGTWAGAFNTGIQGALKFVNMVIPYIQMGVDYYIQGELKDLQRELDNLEQDYADKLEEIEAAWYGLSQAVDLDILSIVTRPHNMGIYEFPEGFYARTLNTNPGILGLEFPGIFTALATLPPQMMGQETMTMDQYYELLAMRST